MPVVCAVVQVQILHAELDEEEVPEGFSLGFSSDAAQSNSDEQAGGGKKRSADEVLRRAITPFSHCRRGSLALH